MAEASGCSLRRSRLAASRRTSSAANPAAGTTAVTRGRPSVRVPVLSTTSVSTFSSRSSASAFLISTPDRAPRPTPTMIDIGVASPSAHGQAMISTETAAIMAKANRGSGPNVAQAAKARTRDRDHQRDEPAGDLVREPLDRRAAALRLSDHLHDPRQNRVASDPVRAHDEGAALIEGAGDHALAHSARDRHGFAGQQRFVDRAMPFDDLAVDRDFFARPHAQAIADRDAVEVDVLVASVGANPARGLGREVQERADRAARPLTRTQLEHLSEQDEHGDDRRRLEIDPDRAVAASKGRQGTDRAPTSRRRCSPRRRRFPSRSA